MDIVFNTRLLSKILAIKIIGENFNPKITLQAAAA